MGSRRLEIRAQSGEPHYAATSSRREACEPPSRRSRGFDADRKAIMAARIERRAARARRQAADRLSRSGSRYIPRTQIKVQDARDGDFVGSEIPADLQRQWIQGTGPAAKPNAPVETSIRNVAYALLSGADGWMFDGEDALGQVSTMSLDNQRNLKLAIHRDPVFMTAAEQVAAEMNQWAQGFFGRPIIDDWRKQLDFTTKIFRAARTPPRRSPRAARRRRAASPRRSSTRRSTSSTTISSCGSRGASLVLYLPKIQTAEEAALWNDILTALEAHLGLAAGHDQGLRARRAARGVLPADGDPRRARHALRRLQHRALGLHQQRRPTRWRGTRDSSIRTSTPSR